MVRARSQGDQSKALSSGRTAALAACTRPVQDQAGQHSGMEEEGLRSTLADRDDRVLLGVCREWTWEEFIFCEYDQNMLYEITKELKKIGLKSSLVCLPQKVEPSPPPPECVLCLPTPFWMKV